MGFIYVECKYPAIHKDKDCQWSGNNTSVIDWQKRAI